MGMPRIQKVFALLFLSVNGFAQYGTAPNNYYPDSYSGSIFTGTVTEAGDQQITLTFSKGNKTDTFSGTFETNCSVPSADGRPLTASAFPKGTVLTAFFR
jgi:hypothetical protein